MPGTEEVAYSCSSAPMEVALTAVVTTAYRLCRALSGKNVSSGGGRSFEVA